MADKVVHFEIPADSVERAREFYRRAFDWNVNTVPGMGYSLIGTTPSDGNGVPTQPGGINGGMLSRQEPVRNPVITIEVASIDESLEKIQKLGGSVVREKRPVGQIGFAAYFKDSEGNVLGLWQVAG